MESSRSDVWNQFEGRYTLTRDASSAQIYKVDYSFHNNRIYSIAEYGSDNTAGAISRYSYSAAASRTLVTTTEINDTNADENNVITTTYTFDDDGNVISEYVYSTDTGNVGSNSSGSGINPHSGEGGASVVSNIDNLLIGHSFETLDNWTPLSGKLDTTYFICLANQGAARSGRKVFRIQSNIEDCIENGVYQELTSLPAGQYAFSAYVQVERDSTGADAGVFLRVTDESGNILGVSERVSTIDSDYTRLIVPFELTETTTVQVQILINGYGKALVDCAQLENNPYANAYNMLENSNFEQDTAGWTCSERAYASAADCFNMSKSLRIDGDFEADCYAYQQPAVRTTRNTRETFTLSGWAKACGLPDREREGVENPPRFRLRAVIKYKDDKYKEYGEEEFTADFSPCTEEWQLASVTFAKSRMRTVEYVRVYCDYGYNAGTAYFDNIQLVRDSIENNLSASDFVVELADDAEDEIAETEAIEVDTAPAFSELTDSFGNTLTETTFNDGELGTIYRAFKFNEDNIATTVDDAGNNLIEETDARGNKTSYTVDSATSRNEEVVDRCGNKTAYEYDDSGRTTKVTSKNANGDTFAHVSYAYDTFDNMTEIVRGDGMKYVLAYNNFHNLESIGIDGKTEKLIQYTYKTGNGRLKQITYANGHTMKATYNSIGQVVAEKWFETAAQAADSTATPIAHYKYVYDGSGNIVRSIDITANKEYNYQYEDGRIVRAAEFDITLSGEIVTAKSIVNTIKYYYDTEGKLIKKVITPTVGSAQTIYYENTDDNTVVKFSAGDRTITSHSKTDSFGRKVFDELQLETGFVSRQFSYMPGAIPEEHRDNKKIKSTATTQLVSQIALSDGRTISYEYDNEERITKVTDSFDGVTEYTYDALGQLLTETKNNVIVNTMTYDNYGNIVSKNDKTYTYDNATWKDLLTSYDGQSITYDAQGNPTSYLGHTLTWEKGRQLKKFVKSDGTVIDYTYNSNGIRTSKTINGVKHTYTLDGTKILRETWGDNTLIPLYDNEDSVCGIIYNDDSYYFIKNLQGDIIAIVDKDAQTVARYSYDAWGVCTITQDSSVDQIAVINPFRYRSYYYDQEIGLYYLQSRYYDASVGRFIISDRAEILIHEEMILFANLMTYCLNEPILRIDSFGTSSGYIDNQNDSSWKSVAVGFWGNVKDNGCGAIALYNILHSYSKKITIKKVLFNLRWMYGSIVYNNIGVVGISPTSVTRYLASKFVFRYTAGPITYLWGIKAELSGGIIVLYQHKGWNSSLHYVAGIKTGGGEGGLFRFYNDSYYEKKYGTKSISIWKYIDLLKENGCKPLLFWGVAGKLGWW